MAGLCTGLVSPLAWIGFRKRKDPRGDLVLACPKCRAQYDPISERKQWHEHVASCAPWHRDYVRACRLAEVPHEERGRVCVAEVDRFFPPREPPADLALERHDFSRSWAATRFEDLKAGDTFRVIYPNGYERDPKTNEPALFRADTDAQVDPNNPQNAGLTGMRLNWSATSRSLA